MTDREDKAVSAWIDARDKGVSLTTEIAFREGYRAAISPENARMREALSKAAEWFDDYARQHDAKGTGEGHSKAVVNQRRAEFCRAALAAPSAS